MLFLLCFVPVSLGGVCGFDDEPPLVIICKMNSRRKGYWLSFVDFIFRYFKIGTVEIFTLFLNIR